MRIASSMLYIVCCISWCRIVFRYCTSPDIVASSLSIPEAMSIYSCVPDLLCLLALLAAVVQPCVQNHTMSSCLASTLYAVMFILAHFVHVFVPHRLHSSMGTSSDLLFRLHLTQVHSSCVSSATEADAD